MNEIAKKLGGEPGEDGMMIFWIPRVEIDFKERIITLLKAIVKCEEDIKNDFGFRNQSIIARLN